MYKKKITKATHTWTCSVAEQIANSSDPSNNRFLRRGIFLGEDSARKKGLIPVEYERRVAQGCAGLEVGNANVPL